jgi:hypothetical protein
MMLTHELVNYVVNHENKWLRNVFRHYVQYLYYKRTISPETYGWLMEVVPSRSYKIDVRPYPINVDDLVKTMAYSKENHKLYYLIYRLMLEGGLRLSHALTLIESFKPDEVDYVINIGMLKSGFLDYVVREAQEVLKRASGRTVKAIIETGYLTVEEIEAVAVRLAEAGIHHVKTCTGYGPRGVAVEDVLVLKRALKERAKIKAAGGMRDRQAVQALINAGADIIGTSAAKHILKPDT